MQQELCTLPPSAKPVNSGLASFVRGQGFDGLAVVIFRCGMSMLAMRPFDESGNELAVSRGALAYVEGRG